MLKETTSDEMVNMMMRQFGANSIKTFPAHVNIVKFDIGPDLRVSYIYEIKEEAGIFLQRVSPCPMVIGKIYNEQDVINIIQEDLNKFRAAYESSKFSTFINLATSSISLEKEIENLFLQHRVSKENLEMLDQQLDKTHRLILSMLKESEELDEK